MNSKITSVVAKEDDGNIQITFTIPAELIASTKSDAVKELSKDITVQGFRKGMAPLPKVEEKISPEKLTEHVLSQILPKAFSDAVTNEKINPAIYPKFEAVKIEPDTDWQIRATTCELPKIVLGDYKKKLEGELRSKSIMVPGKEITKDEKESNLIKAILETIKINIPKILIEEEVNGRLSQLLSRIEKLGLSLEGYLKSVGKTPDKLREEYVIQAKDAISLELILNEVANEEKIDVDEKKVDEFIKSTGSDPTKVEKDQRNALKRVILRRSALDKLASLM